MTYFTTMLSMQSAQKLMFQRRIPLDLAGPVTMLSGLFISTEKLHSSIVHSLHGAKPPVHSAFISISIKCAPSCLVFSFKGTLSAPAYTSQASLMLNSYSPTFSLPSIQTIYAWRPLANGVSNNVPPSLSDTNTLASCYKAASEALLELVHLGTTPVPPKI